MKLNIIVPIRNCPTLCYRMLDSVWSEMRDNPEVCLTLVDDASTDETPDVLERWAEGRDRVKVILLKEHRGIGGARNAGIEVSDADYVSFVDADDRIVPGYCSKILQRIAETSAECIVWGLNIVSDKPIGRWIPNPKNADDFVRGPISPTIKAIRRDKLVRFSENMACEDAAWWFQQADNLESAATISESLYVYDRRFESTTSPFRFLVKHPQSVESLARSNILVTRGLNDRVISDVLRALAELYDLRNTIQRPHVKEALLDRISSCSANIITGRWNY